MRKSAIAALFSVMLAASASARQGRRPSSLRPVSPPIATRIWLFIRAEIRGLVPASPMDGHVIPPSSPAPAPASPTGG